MTRLGKIIKQIQRQPQKVKATDFVKMLSKEGFIMRKGDQKKIHRHFFHPDRPELMIVVVFSDGENTILDEGYVRKYLKEINK